VTLHACASHKHASALPLHVFKIEDFKSEALDQGNLKGDFACKGFALDLVLRTSMLLKSKILDR